MTNINDTLATHARERDSHARTRGLSLDDRGRLRDAIHYAQVEDAQAMQRTHEAVVAALPADVMGPGDFGPALTPARPVPSATRSFWG